MVRPTISVTAAILVLAPVIGVAQQETSGTGDSVSADTRQSPEAQAVREGVASALDEAVVFPKAIPTPPTGTWGITAVGTGGGGIFSDSDSDAEAWLGANGTGVTGYGSTSGGFFQSSTSSGFARLGFGDWGIGAGGNFTGGYFADADGSGYAWLGYDRPSGTDRGGTPNAGEYGVYAGGNEGGGYFEGIIGATYAYVGHGGSGIDAYGANRGGKFVNTSGFGRVYLAQVNWGVNAEGDAVGGLFADSDGSGKALIAYDRILGMTDNGGAANDGEYGVYAIGDKAGGYFEEGDSSSHVYLAGEGSGVSAYGATLGGEFENASWSGLARLAAGDVGVFGEGSVEGGRFFHTGSSTRAFLARNLTSGTDAGGDANNGEYGVYAEGGHAGGYFEDTDDSAYAYVAHGTEGIKAYGSETGGYFKDTNSSGTGYVGRGNLGIWAFGDNAGGWFENSVGPGRTRLAYDRPFGMDDKKGDPNDGEYGVYAEGDLAGGYFEDAGDSGHAYVGRSGSGIIAWGSDAVGQFYNTTSSSFGLVGYGTYKISGTGAVSFVQNHPYDSNSVIVYAAPEGDEVATYTRGTARLSGGEATVSLGETFKWVTNPDIGLTAHLTPRGEPVPLAVVDLSTDEMIVRGDESSPEGLVFDYVVYGLRIGFEETSVVQEKEMDAYIPSMSSHRELYQRRPDLRRFNSLERFKGMRQVVSKTDELDLSGANALRDAIIEFDPAVHELPRAPGFNDGAGGEISDGVEGQRQVLQEGDGIRAARVERGGRRAPDGYDLAATVPVDGEGNVYATSFRPSSADLASLVDVSEAVEPGDVLVIDRGSAGMMRRGFEAHDTGVVGVVAANPGVVLGSVSPAEDESGMASSIRAEVAMAGVVRCKVDAAFGAIWPGDLLVTSPTPGHAMRADSPLPGTIVGKALQPLEEGAGLIRVLVMLR